MVDWTGSIWGFCGLSNSVAVAARLWPAQWLQIVDGFYRAGARVFGGGHVVLSLLEKASRR